MTVSTSDIDRVLDGIANDCRIRVNHKQQRALLSRPEFQGVSTTSLIRAAEVRLHGSRLGAIQGIRPTDRKTAIAILVGIVDRTVRK